MEKIIEAMQLIAGQIEKMNKMIGDLADSVQKLTVVVKSLRSRVERLEEGSSLQ